MFEFYYLVYHFICFTGFFYSLIIFMNSYIDNQQLQFNRDINNSTFNINQDIENIINTFETKIIDDDETLVVQVNNTSTSYLNLILLNIMYNNNTKIAVNLTEESDDKIKLFCRKLGFIYFNKKEEYDDKYINYTNNNIMNEMVEYCNKTYSDHCFTLLNNEDMMEYVLEKLYNFSFNENEQKLKQSYYQGINFYNLLINQTEEDINRIVDDLDIEYDNSSNTNSEFINNYFNLLDFKHNNWRNNLSTVYHQLYMNNKTDHKIEEIFNIKKYLFGFTIELIDDVIPFWMWDDLFTYISENISNDIEKHVIQTLFFSIVNNHDNIDTYLASSWRLNYSNNVIVIYNVSQLQCNIDEVDIMEKNVYNSISSFLDGDIVYEIIDDSNEDYLFFNNVNLNLEDTNNELLFYNFTFKNLGKGTICSK
jgi:hypothetical protein